MQIRIAFQQVASAIGWFIYAYRDIAEWSATVDRLAGFEAALSAPLPGSCVRQGECVAACGLVRSKTASRFLKTSASGPSRPSHRREGCFRHRQDHAPSRPRGLLALG